jgi:hypothetical protein
MNSVGIFCLLARRDGARDQSCVLQAVTQRGAEYESLLTASKTRAKLTAYTIMEASQAFGDRRQQASCERPK